LLKIVVILSHSGKLFKQFRVQPSGCQLHWLKLMLEL
jgi:hypothetical protein